MDPPLQVCFTRKLHKGSGLHVFLPLVSAKHRRGAEASIKGTTDIEVRKKQEPPDDLVGLVISLSLSVIWFLFYQIL